MSQLSQASPLPNIKDKIMVCYLSGVKNTSEDRLTYVPQFLELNIFKVNFGSKTLVSFACLFTGMYFDFASFP